VPSTLDGNGTAPDVWQNAARGLLAGPSFMAMWGFQLGDSLATGLLPAAIALRNQIGRGSDGWARPICQRLTSRPGPKHPTREQAGTENPDKSGT